MFTNYKYVYTLYQIGSFTKAAEALYISQPALSVAIRNTENKLGAELFERTGRGVRLTQIGREYIAAAEELMRIENELKTRIHDINALESGSITVGGSNYLSSYVLPKIINVFTDLHPKIEIALTEASSCKLAEMLDRDQVDLVVDNPEYTDGCEIYPLVQEALLLCVPKDRPINGQLTQYQIQPDDIYHGTVNMDSIGQVSIEVFMEEPFILLKPGNDMCERARKIFAQSNMVPQVQFQVDQLNISYALTESGIGISFITDTYFKHARFRDDVVLYKVRGLGCRTLCIAHKQKKYLSRAMAEFIKVAKEVIR